MEFIHGCKYVGYKGDFKIEIFPTIVTKMGRDLEYWYAHTWIGGIYSRQHHSIGLPTIHRILAKNGLRADDLSWEEEESVIYWTMPWKQKYNNMDNCIYIIHAVGTDRVKIGWALSLHGRLNLLSCASPFPLVVLHAMPGDRSEEAALHRKFSHLQLHNEWFLFSEEIKAFVETIKIGEN